MQGVTMYHHGDQGVHWRRRAYSSERPVGDGVAQVCHDRYSGHHHLEWERKPRA
jgi:hypothetical protein